MRPKLPTPDARLVNLLQICGLAAIVLGDTNEGHAIRLLQARIGRSGGGMKAVRDAVAKWLGVDDADDRVRWRCRLHEARRGR